MNLLHEGEARFELVSQAKSRKIELLLPERRHRNAKRWDEAFLDAASLQPERGSGIDKTKRGKGTKWMVLVDDPDHPLGVRLGSATPADTVCRQSAR